MRMYVYREVGEKKRSRVALLDITAMVVKGVGLIPPPQPPGLLTGR